MGRFLFVPTTLPLQKMSRKEKLIALEELWADLSRDEMELDSPGWHADALRETERLVKAGKAKFSDWDEAKERMRKAAKCL